MFNPFRFLWWHISFVAIKIKYRLFSNRKKRIALFDQRLNADKNAEDFIKNCTDCGGNVMKKAPSKSTLVLNELNSDHLERLSREVDPLTDVDEIQEDSVKSGNAEISEIGTRSRQLWTGESLDYDSEIKRRG